MKHIVHFAKQAIRITATGTPARDMVHFMFGLMPHYGADAPHAELSLASLPDSENLRLIYPQIDHSVTVHLHNDAHFSNQPKGAIQGSPSEVAPHLMYAVDFHLANLCQEGLYLHAASLEKNGKAIIMPATSGSGKSTLTCWMAVRGFRYLSDEATFIENDSTTCTGFTRPAVLKKGSEHILPDLVADSQLRLVTLHGKEYGWMISPERLNPIQKGAHLPIGCFIFSRYKPQGHLTCEHLSPATTAFELAKCLINARNLLNHGFPQMLRLAHILPGWKLSYSDLKDAQKCIEEITSF